MPSLETETTIELTRRLRNAGWQSTDDDEVPSFTLQESEEIVYLLGCNLAVRDYGIWINPGLGVQHPETSRLAVKFAGLEPTGSGVGTIGFSLSDLLYRDGHRIAPFTRWMIKSNDDIATVIDALCNDVDSYGMPTLRSFTSLDDIIVQLKKQQGDHVYQRHLAIASALTGRTSDALLALSSYAAGIKNQQPPLSTRTRAFVKSFVEHFNISSQDLTPELTHCL